MTLKIDSPHTSNTKKLQKKKNRLWKQDGPSCLCELETAQITNKTRLEKIIPEIVIVIVTVTEIIIKLE